MIKKTQRVCRKEGVDMKSDVREGKRKRAPELITPEANFRIFGFMRTELGLEKTELLVYALIYSYFRSATPFTASREYISEWVGSGLSAVDTAIARLVEKGYITKSQRYVYGRALTEHSITISALPAISDHLGILKLHRDERIKCRDM